MLIRLAFFGLLRVSEFLALTAGDLMIPRLSAYVKTCVVAIRSPKNRNRMGKRQFATINDQSTVEWLRWFLKGLLPGQRLWPYTRAKLMNVFKGLLAELHIAHLGLSLSSCRCGGATHLFLLGMGQLQLQEKGRWANAHSLAIYIQEVMSALTWQQIEPDTEMYLIQLAQDAELVWAAPPCLP